jgi:hypothetical protein
MTIWQQDFVRRKPLFWLAAHFRCTDDRLSYGENDPIADTGAQLFLTPPSAQRRRRH